MRARGLRCATHVCSVVATAPLLFRCGHAACAACLATPTGRGTGACPLRGCEPAGVAEPDKSAPDAAPDALRAQRVAALRIFCQVRAIA